MKKSFRKAVLITGAARRLGAAMALHFAEQGYDIALHYHHSQSDAEVVAKQCEAVGAKVVLLCQDLTQLEALPHLVRQAQEVLPHLQVLINNASTFRRISFADTTPESFAADMTINVTAPFFLTQAFAKQVQQGAVINMLDTAITGYFGQYFAYLMAKKSLAEFTQMAARELGEDIRVNGICPGFVLPTESSENDAAAAHDPVDPVRPTICGEAPTPQSIATTALMLAKSSQLTGQLIFVDGGEQLQC